MQKELLVWLEIGPNKINFYKEKFLVIYNGARQYEFIERDFIGKFNLISLEVLLYKNHMMYLSK